MSKSYERTILGRPVRFYLSSDKGERGYEKGWHGRLSAYLDESCRRVFNVEYHVPSHHYGIAFRANHNDEPLHASFNCGLFGVYLSVSLPIFAKLRDAIIKAWPLDRQSYSFSGRDFSITFHDHAVWWSVGADDMGWSSGTPRWRHGGWHPLGHNMRQGEPELLEERPILVPMEERSYRGKAKLERTRWGFTKLPRMFDRIDYHVTIDMEKGEQVPFPGKGENSYDCGMDGAFGMSCRASSIEEGVGHLVGSVMRDRKRYGGTNWKYEPELEEGAA